MEGDDLAIGAQSMIDDIAEAVAEHAYCPVLVFHDGASTAKAA